MGVRARFRQAIAQLRTFRFMRQLLRHEQDLRLEAETLNAVARDLAAELDLRALVQKVTDACTSLTGAAFGAFFYNTVDERGQSYTLYTLSGVPRESFEGLGMPRNTPMFGPTFRGEGVVRVDDVRKDPRYGQNPPHRGLPDGHPAVRSYLAVPVVARSGEVLGGLLFGHPEAGVFTEHHERVAIGIAAQAGIAIDNARLYGRATQDLAARAEIEAALRASEKRYRRLVQNLPAAVYSCDAQGRITLYNQAAVELWGGEPALHAEPWCGRPDLSRPDGTPISLDDSPMGRVLRDGGSHPREEIVIRRPDGSRRNVLAHSEALLDASGHLSGALHMLVDITDLRRAEQALRESEERLRLAMQTGKVGVWDWNVVDDVITWSDAVYTLHGVTRETFVPTIESFRGLVHPDDRERVGEAIRRTLEEGAPYEIELRVLQPGGDVVWLFTNALVVREGGRPVRMLGATLDITERKRVEESLREGDRRKDEFLAILAHELRNPLAPLANGIQIIRVAPDDPEAVARAREMMERQMVQLVRLTDDLLDVSRIQRGKVELRREIVDLAVVARTAIEASRPLIDEARHRLDLRLPAARVFVNADPVRLAQVFSNLLNNAAKYTPPGGRLGLAVELEGGEAVVAVSDTGVGMRREALASVFDMFTQLDRSQGRPHDGLGLGLTIVKQIVEMHGGSVAAHSEGVGKGSTFTMRLPVVATPRAASPAAPDPRAAATSRRVLIVDDSEDAAISLGILLDRLGHQVQTEHDPVAAVARAEAFRPDVVLLDIGMPGLSGLDVCARLRSHPWGQAMSIVAVTGWGQERDRVRSKEAGFDHHLVKPVELEKLKKLLATGTRRASIDDVTAAP
jgi:two-component system CheB/CheR fusion protein